MQGGCDSAVGTTGGAEAEVQIPVVPGGDAWGCYGQREHDRWHPKGVAVRKSCEGMRLPFSGRGSARARNLRIAESLPMRGVYTICVRLAFRLVEDRFTGKLIMRPLCSVICLHS